MSGKENKELTLDSRYEEIERVKPFVNELQSRIGFEEETYQRVRLALSEAVTNAIIHGNKENPSKTVYIKAQWSEGDLKISVKDEGEGFDPAKLPDPLKEENLLKEGGRGIFLIKQYADNVSFEDNGTKMEISFSLN